LKLYRRGLCEMQKIWDEYEKRLITTEYLIRDGIRDDKKDQYKENGKVLFVLKESNESQVKDCDKKSKSLFDSDGWFGLYKRDGRGISNDKMLTKMIKMHKYIARVRSAKKDEKCLVECGDAEVLRHEDVFNFAFININKRGHGGNSVADKKIKKCLYQDADLLREQIKYLEPEVIVVGGKGISASFEEEIINKVKLKKQPIVIKTSHFSRVGYDAFKKDACKKL